MNSTFAPFAEAWWTWIAPLSAQIAVLGIVFALVERMGLRRAPVRIRAAFGWALLARMPIPPHFESPVAILGALGMPLAEFASATARPDLDVTLCLTWLSGIVVMTISAARRGCADRAAWLEDARTAPRDVQERVLMLGQRLGLSSVPRIVVRAGASGAAVVGVLRPVVVLSESIAAQPDGRRFEHVVLHELAHIARRDGWAALAWTVARIAFWFHPAVHWTAAHAATLREIACDARAVRGSREPAAYRASLLDCARDLDAKGTVWRRTAAVARFTPWRAQILCRLDALAQPSRGSHTRETVSAVLAFALLCTCVIPLARTPPPDANRDFAELEGCLRKRFAVMAALAAEDGARSDR